MDALRSLVQPLVGNGGGSSIVDGVKLVVLGTTVETARRVSSSAWSHFVNSFFLTAHFSEEDYPYDWLMLWLSRRPEWQRSREFETTTRSSSVLCGTDNSFGDEDDPEGSGNKSPDDDAPGKVKTRVVFQPTFDSTHTIYYRAHWLRVKRSRNSSGSEVLSISVVARNNSILKQLVLQAKREYEAESVHRIQIYFADSHGSWRWTDSRHKRPMSSIVLNPGVKEMLLSDTKDFLRSEKWYADRGIPFRRGYLLYGVPGSGKSSLIHAIAGELMLDIYVVSLSSSWINDATLTTLMGRVPARCIVLLEDLDAAFTRSVSREGKEGELNKGNSGKEGEKKDEKGVSGSGMGDEGLGWDGGRRRKDGISDVNTLSLSGLLNALDGVAAAEGRLLFATTNHLDRLDPALSRPGRMDVWIEFKNASKWQAELLFRNFFPSSDGTDADPPIDVGEEEERELEGVDIPTVPSSPGGGGGQGTPQTPSSLFSLPSFTSSSTSLGSMPTTSHGARSPRSTTTTASSSGHSRASSLAPELAGQAYLPPPVEEHVAAAYGHSAVPLSAARLGELAKTFADAIPDEEFSVAALQGYLLKNKSRPEAAAGDAAGWVVSERELKEKMRKEREARELRERLERERRRKEIAEEKRKAELEKAAEERRLAEEARKELEREKEKEEEAKGQAPKEGDDQLEEQAVDAPAEATVDGSETESIFRFSVIENENGNEGAAVPS